MSDELTKGVNQLLDFFFENLFCDFVIVEQSNDTFSFELGVEFWNHSRSTMDSKRVFYTLSFHKGHERFFLKEFWCHIPTLRSATNIAGICNANFKWIAEKHAIRQSRQAWRRVKEYTI